MMDEKKLTVDAVYAVIRERGKIRYKDLAVHFGIDPGVMTLKNKLTKLRQRGLIRYVPAESAWEVCDGRSDGI